MKFFATMAVFLAATVGSFTQATGQMSHIADVRFVSGSKSTEIPFTIANNLVILKARVNDSEPAWFIFDTGAESTVIDAGFAKELSLKHSGTTLGTGSAGTATAGVIRGASLRLGDLGATNITLYSLALSGFTPAFGMKISGIIGNDVTRYVVADIDYEKSVLHLYSPETFTPPAGVEQIPLIIEGNLPFVRTTIVPQGRRAIPAKLELDTGSTGALLFNSPFVQRNRLISSLKSSFNAKTGGVGGSGQSTVGRIASLDLGRTTVKSPIAVLYRGTRGDNASAKYDGLLGGAVFRRFRFIVDMPGRRAFFQPTASLADPFDADMSGLELVADGAELKTLLIDDVFVGSAGAKAGVKGGDILETIDGRGASDIGLQEVRRMFRQDGSTYRLGLRRGKEIVYVDLRLARVI